MIRKNKIYFPKNSLFYVNFSIEAPFLPISAYITFAFITLQNLKLSKSKLIIFLIPVNDFSYSGRKFLIVIGGFHLHKTKKSLEIFPVLELNTEMYYREIQTRKKSAL